MTIQAVIILLTISIDRGPTDALETYELNAVSEVFAVYALDST
jgi:hypothetical protein